MAARTTDTVFYRDFFAKVLNDLKIGPRTAAMRAFGVLVQIEGRNDYWNPLNSVIAIPGSTTLPGNNAGVQRYPSYTAGIQGTVALLSQPRWKWAVEAMSCAVYRDLILRQFEVEYATWGSHPDFYSPTAKQADKMLATVMSG